MKRIVGHMSDDTLKGFEDLKVAQTEHEELRKRWCATMEQANAEFAEAHRKNINAIQQKDAAVTSLQTLAWFAALLLLNHPPRWLQKHVLPLIM